MDEKPIVVRLTLWKAFVILAAFMAGATLAGAGVAAACMYFFP